MTGRLSLALASMAMVALFAAQAQAAIVAEWLLDDPGPIILGSTVATDTVNGFNGEYRDSSFFASGAAESVTGHTGVPNSAIHFNKDAYVYIDAPRDPNDTCGQGDPCGGIIGYDPDSSMVELWFKLHVNSTATFYEESLPGGGGGEILLRPTTGVGGIEYQIEPFDGSGDDVMDTSNVPTVNVPGGLNQEQWYYAAGVLVAPKFELDANGDPVLDANGDPIVVELGSDHVYLYDGTQVFSDSRDRTAAFFNPFGGADSALDKATLNSGVVGGDVTLDDVRVFDEAFDPQSFLFLELGIPEPSSLALLALGGLLLTRRRQHI